MIHEGRTYCLQASGGSSTFVFEPDKGNTGICPIKVPIRTVKAQSLRHAAIMGLYGLWECIDTVLFQDIRPGMIEVTLVYNFGKANHKYHEPKEDL